MGTVGYASGKSSGGPPQSKTRGVSRRFAYSAKRHGVRQPSGALQTDEMSARFPHDLLSANDNMNCPVKQISVPTGTAQCAWLGALFFLVFNPNSRLAAQTNLVVAADVHFVTTISDFRAALVNYPTRPVHTCQQPVGSPRFYFYAKQKITTRERFVRSGAPQVSGERDCPS